MSAETPDYLRINRDAWTKSNARYTDGRADEAWAQQAVAAYHRLWTVVNELTACEVAELRRQIRERQRERTRRK